MRNQLPPTSSLAGPVLGALVLISLLAGKALAQYAPDYVPADMLEPPPQAGRIEWHGLSIGPRASANARYNDQLFLRSATDVSDFIWTLSPGVSVVAGGPVVERYREFRLDYQPALNLYTDHSEYSDVDHRAAFGLFLPLNRLAFKADATYAAVREPVLGALDFSRRHDLRSSLLAEYLFSDKTTASTALRYSLLDYSGGPALTGYQDLGNDTWLNYLPSPKLGLGLGFAWGRFEVQDDPGQTYERILARALYRLSEKLDLTVVAGGELRQYDGDAADTSGLVFDLGGTFRPREGTSFQVEGHRRETPSAWTAGENYVNTGGSVGVRQRLAEKWTALLSLGYNHLDFQSVSATTTTSRSDDYFLARVGVDFRLNPEWTFGLLYQRQSDDSNVGIYNFSQNQVGLYVNWKP